MNEIQKKKIIDGVTTSFLDAKYPSVNEYKPQFVSNDYAVGKKVLSSIENELAKCEEFFVSVAFITQGGLTTLLQTLKELEKKNIPRKILTTNYLHFSQPEALKKLHSLKNIELKMYDVEQSDIGFHTKGFLFKKDEVYRLLIGSSNLTMAALTVSKEWNTMFTSSKDGEMRQEILSEFESLWNSGYAKNFDTFFEPYCQKYASIKQKRDEAEEHTKYVISFDDIQPNSMQRNFIMNLQKIIHQGEKRALLISATGTGKTYASAFAMRELDFKRVLFLVHRGELAKQAKLSYERVFKKRISTGFIGNGKFETESDYIFAMVQTLNRDEYLHQFNPEDFDCIIFDEAHHSSANTYQKIMSYFKPKLFLGMTATPDKRDDQMEGKNIYEIFNHQIAYNIRLQQAMEENLLCPFHYFGISDITMIQNRMIRKIEKEDFKYLTQEERLDSIIQNANYYGYSGSRVKGLIFCSRNDEAQKLSEMMNEKINPETGKNYRTIALSGESSDELRQRSFERLAMEENTNSPLQPLDYIFSVDLLNEGLDIIETNQVIMLRPTQSPIIFIQQLGRGLRKAPNKEYVVILDFIGNYENNFMIPIALSGDRSYNKDNIRHYVTEGSRMIPGSSTIHFDEIARQQIYAAIDKANFSDIKLIKECYKNLKDRLGRIPSLIDFEKEGEIDPVRIFENKSLGSYYQFLVKYEKSYTLRLSQDEEKLIEFISTKIANGKRIQELQMIQRMMQYANSIEKVGLFAQLDKDMITLYNKTVSKNQKENLINVLTNQFPTGSGASKYKGCVLIEKQGNDYSISESLKRYLANPDFCTVLNDLIEFGIMRNRSRFSHTYKNTDLVLYEKYTFEDVCRILNWETNEVPINISGYKFDTKTNTLPIFINYNKQDDISETTKYEDRFIDNQNLIAISRTCR